MISNRRILLHYISYAVFRVKHRSIILWGNLAAIVAVIVFHIAWQPKQSFWFGPSMKIRLSILSILTIALCYSIESRYVTSEEYKYFRSLPIPRSVRFLSIVIRQLPFSNVLSLIVVLSMNGARQNLLLIPYINLVIIALSTSINHLISTVKQITRKLSSLRYGILIATALIVLSISVLIIRMPKEEAFSLIAAGSNFVILLISSPCIGVFLLAFIWLIIFFFLKQPYELVILSRYSRRLVKNGRVYKKLLSNLIVKDVLTAFRLPVVTFFVILQLVMGAYLAYNRASLSASAVFIIIVAFITSMLTEQFFHDEIIMKSLLKTLPVDLKKYFWARIFSVSLVLAAPSFIALLIQIPFASVRFLDLLLSILAVFVIVFMWCGMQCSVILSNLENEHSIQSQLTALVLISVVFPVIPFFLLLTGYRKAMTVYCED